jgi:hypothetical protein
MNREIADKWAAALRSGKYRQGVGQLRQVSYTDDNYNTFSYCCLGVLCDLHDSEKWRYIDYAGSRTTPPDSVLHWAGIQRRCAPDLDSIDLFVDLNDFQNKSFSDIAMHIELNAENL